MKLKKVMAAALAVAILLFCGTGVSAATAESEKNPDILFYRAKARDTFEGEIALPAGKGAVTGVQLSQEETPAMVISGFDGSAAWFDSLYRSAEQVLIITRDSKETEVPVSLAVYDSVTLIPVQGSVTLTVKNGKTFQPIAGAEYALYKGSKRLEDGLYSDSSGKITVTNLEPGSYDLRPSSTVEGYQAAGSTIPFVIGGMKLSGGEQSIRTSAGKKITAEEDEVLIAGNFTKDIELTATKEDQITSISVTYANAGAELEKSGKKEERTFGTAKEAESDINQRKANGEITGSVEIAYTLKGGSGKSTCNFTQYLEAKPAAVATPKPDGNSGTQNGNSSNGGQTYTPTPTPSPTVKPIATPQPITQPIENLTIASFADNGKLSGFVFRLEGTTVDGNSYVKEYKTDEKGEITGIIPAGTYIVSAKDCTANKGYELPQDQVVQVTATEKEYLSFAFVSTERNLTLAVTDDDGVPLENVTVGIFSAELLDEVEEDRDPKTQTNGVTDVSQQISDIHAQEDREALLANPFEKRNALKIGKTDEKGIVELEGLPVTALLAVPIDTPVGYTMEKKPSQIPAGLQTQADVTCEYVKVDVQVVNRKTGSPAMGIQAVLLDEEGNELAQWTTDGKEQTFIRVPEGEYTAVTKLQLLQSEHKKRKYQLEDAITQDIPAKIIKCKQHISGCLKDIKLRDSHPVPGEDFVGMELMGNHYSNAKEAGTALLMLKSVAEPNEDVRIGSYRGFELLIRLTNFGQIHTLMLKGSLSYPVQMGDSCHGNLIRIENVLADLEPKCEEYKAALQSAEIDLEQAKVDVKLPFAQEAELRSMEARLSELNVLVDLDSREYHGEDSALRSFADRLYALTALYAPAELPEHSTPEQAKESLISCIKAGNSKAVEESIQKVLQGCPDSIKNEFDYLPEEATALITEYSKDPEQASEQRI